MKVKRLIERLKQFNENADVSIYNNSNGMELIILDNKWSVETDEDVDKEFENPKGTVYIHGK